MELPATPKLLQTSEVLGGLQEQIGLSMMPLPAIASSRASTSIKPFVAATSSSLLEKVVSFIRGWPRLAASSACRTCLTLSDPNARTVP